MSKRKKIVVGAILMGITLAGLTSAPYIDRFLAIAIASVMSVSLTVWALSGNVQKNATALVLILPALFTLGVSLFWFLLPTTLLARLPVLVIYSIGMYAIMLTANIFCVSVVRSIALLRAAKSVSFVMTLFSAFFLYDALFSIKSSIVVNSMASFLIAFLLSLPVYWSVLLTPKVDREVVVSSLITSYLMAASAVALYFWPATVAVSSIFATSSLYVLIGLTQAHLDKRLFVSTTREYLLVGAVVFLTMLASTRWR